MKWQYQRASIITIEMLKFHNADNLAIYLSSIKHACCSIYFTTFRLRSCHECLCSIPWKLLSIRIFIDQRRTMTSPISSKLLWVFKFPPILFYLTTTRSEWFMDINLWKTQILQTMSSLQNLPAGSCFQVNYYLLKINLLSNNGKF